MALKVKRVEVTPLAPQGCRIENLLPDAVGENTVFQCETYDSEVITGYFVPFADYLADRSILPLGSSALVTCQGEVLIGQRSKRMREYPLHFELMPSKGIDSCDGTEALLRQCAGDAIDTHCVEEIKPLALIEDPIQRSLDICMLIELSSRPELDLRSEECIGARWVSIEEFRLLIDAAPVVPTSVALFEHWQATC